MIKNIISIGDSIRKHIKYENNNIELDSFVGLGSNVININRNTIVITVNKRYSNIMHLLSPTCNLCNTRI